MKKVILNEKACNEYVKNNYYVLNAELSLSYENGKDYLITFDYDTAKFTKEIVILQHIKNTRGFKVIA